MSMFQIESKAHLDLTSDDLVVYKLHNHDFRVIFINVPGPLVSSSIIVPTLSTNNHGLAHTLEHLIFCGSKSIPHRGYLDNLATRCLSTGTNAYTSEDLTCYEISTVGSEGMANVLPVFLDHILNPNLRLRQFMTEVFHVDGTAKHQGVVYCEMASRENTESDLLDFAIRKSIYSNASTYSYECGGLTKDIINLTNDQVKLYHEEFYHLDNITVVICGMVDHQSILGELSSFSGLLAKETPKNIPKKTIFIPQIPRKCTSELTTIVPFPSSDDKVGSIAMAWRGPKSEDVETIVALVILFRYFNDTPASPFPQKFVERANPLASNVDFDLKSYVETGIVLSFNGVPRNINDSESSNGSEDSDSAEESSDEEDSEDSFSVDGDSEDEPPKDLFELGVYEGLVRAVIQDFANTGFSSKTIVLETIDRHKRKILEALEEEPHETLISHILPDIIRHFFASNSSLCDTRYQNGKPIIGTRGNILKVLKSLEEKPLQYWKDLAKEWLLDAPMCQVIMVPDTKMADAIAQKDSHDQKMRAEMMGPKGLQNLQNELDLAIKDNEVNLTESLKEKMPPIPNASNAPRINSKMEVIGTKSSLLFFETQLVQTDTLFTHFRLGFNLDSIPKKLRPFLVLFQELLFQTHLEYYDDSGNLVFWDYKKVCNETAKLLISHEAAVGFGNDVWTSGWLANVFMVYANTLVQNWKLSFELLCRVLLFSKFEKMRIQTTAKNLLNEITEIKRDGCSMLISASTRISFSNRDSFGCNDLDISIFKQQDFLQEIVSKCKSGQDADIINNLNDLRQYILGKNGKGPGFAQFSVPFSFDEQKLPSEIQKSIMNVWESELSKYLKQEKFSPKSSDAVPFPYPRAPFQFEDVADSFSVATIIPIQGLGASFLFQIVPCNVLMPNPDYFPLVLLIEILSRTEGPLYTSIRGKGYAYGAGLSLYLWSGQLCFELMDASEPYRGLLAFYEILKILSDEIGFNTICNDFDTETAMASIAYRHVSERATSSSIITQALRASLRGYTSLRDSEDAIRELYLVTKDDLKRVFQKYVKPFLSLEKLTFITTTEGENVDVMIKDFESCQINLKKTTLEDLKISEIHQRKKRV